MTLYEKSRDIFTTRLIGESHNGKDLMIYISKIGFT